MPKLDSVLAAQNERVRRVTRSDELLADEIAR